MWTAILGLLTTADAAGPVVGPVDIGRYDGHAYAFVDQMLTLAEAEAACALIGGALAQVDTADELWWLHDRVHGGPRLNGSAWSWIGSSKLSPIAGPAVLQYAWDRTVQRAFVSVQAVDRHKPICERVIR